MKSIILNFRKTGVVAVLLLSFILVCPSCKDSDPVTPEGEDPELPIENKITKIKDIVIYENPEFYVTSPSVVKNDGEYLVAFRSAPDNLLFGETNYSFTHVNSYLKLVRSNDGENWTQDAEMIYAHPYGGAQDPCLLKLNDGTLLCSGYGWCKLSAERANGLKQPVYYNRGFVSLGGYVLRSSDNGKTWSSPIYPPRVDGSDYKDVFGDPLAAYNRGALYQGKSGRVYWVVTRLDDATQERFSNHLLISDDSGRTWSYSAEVAADSGHSFGEASVYETPKGDIVAFIRMDDMKTSISRSTDGGKTFKWETMGFNGHALAAVRLPDDRVFLTYGYRQEPCGIRCKILDAECSDFATAEEFILRDDNGRGTDVGYSWPVVIDNSKVLVVYYITGPNGNRTISGTIVDVSTGKVN